jgi:pilus assembly protein CpaE
VGAEKIRLLVVEDVPQVASHIRALLAAQSAITVLDVVTNGDRAVGVVGELHPDVVIVDALLQGRPGGRTVASMIRQAEPEAGIVMLTVPQNPIQEDAEHGIDTVLTMPLNGFDLLLAIRRAAEERRGQSGHGRSMIISLFSPKGGVGRTTLAFNLAVALAGDGPVCLMDGSLQFSDLRGLLRVPPTAPSMLDLPTERIREADVSEVLWRDPAGIDVLLAPPRVEMAEMVTTSDLEKFLSLLRRMYAYVVVDTRASLDEDVLAILDASDRILQVLAFDAMAIRSLAMARETFTAIGYSPSKLSVVLNRADTAGGMDRADVEAAIGGPIDFEIVSDGRLVLAANNEGVPFVSASPDAPIAAGVRAIAAALTAGRTRPAASLVAH